MRNVGIFSGLNPRPTPVNSGRMKTWERCVTTTAPEVASRRWRKKSMSTSPSIGSRNSLLSRWWAEGGWLALAVETRRWDTQRQKHFWAQDFEYLWFLSLSSLKFFSDVKKIPTKDKLLSKIQFVWQRNRLSSVPELRADTKNSSFMYRARIHFEPLGHKYYHAKWSWHCQLLVSCSKIQQCLNVWPCGWKCIRARYLQC